MELEGVATVGMGAMESEDEDELDVGGNTGAGNVRATPVAAAGTRVEAEKERGLAEGDVGDTAVDLKGVIGKVG